MYAALAHVNSAFVTFTVSTMLFVGLVTQLLVASWCGKQEAKLVDEVAA